MILNFVELIEGIEVVKVFGVEDEIGFKVERSFVRLLKNVFKVGDLNNL